MIYFYSPTDAAPQFLQKLTPFNPETAVHYPLLCVDSFLTFTSRVG